MHSSSVEEFCAQHHPESINFGNSVFSWAFLKPRITKFENLVECIANENIPFDELWEYFKHWPDATIEQQRQFLTEVTQVTRCRYLPPDFYKYFLERCWITNYFLFRSFDLAFIVGLGGVRWDTMNSTYLFENPHLTLQFLIDSHCLESLYDFLDYSFVPLRIVSSLNDNPDLTFEQKRAILKYLKIWHKPQALVLKDLSWSSIEERFVEYLNEGISVIELFDVMYRRGEIEKLDYLLHRYPQFLHALCENNIDLRSYRETPWILLQHFTDAIIAKGEIGFLRFCTFVPLDFFLVRVVPHHEIKGTTTKFSTHDILKYRSGLTPNIIEQLLQLESKPYRAVEQLLQNNMISCSIVEQYYERYRTDINLNNVARALSYNNNMPLSFYERYPETIVPDVFMLNRFIYQRHLENNELEITLAWNALQMLEGDGLVHIVLNIINENTQRLERIGHLQEVFSC